MRKLFLLFAVVFFASNAFAAELRDNNYSGNDAGYLVMSLRHTRDVGFISFVVNFRKLDRSDSGYFRYFNPSTPLGLVRSPDFGPDNDVGTVFVRTLPPGDYAFYRFSIMTGIGVRFSLPFTIKTGETTYLGEFRMMSWLPKEDFVASLGRHLYQAKQRQNGNIPDPTIDREERIPIELLERASIVADDHIGGRGRTVEDTGGIEEDRTDAGFYFVVSDNMDRDLAIARQKKEPPRGAVTASVPDAALLNAPIFRSEPDNKITSNQGMGPYLDGRYALTLRNPAARTTRAMTGFSAALSATDLYPYLQTSARNYRGNLYVEAKRFDEAIADFDQAIAIDRFAYVAYSNRGLARRLTGQLDSAIADQTEAIRIAPDYAIAYIRRATTYFAGNKFDLALSDADEAVRLDPKNAFLYADRGMVYRALGRFDLAIADYSKAIEIKRFQEIIHDHYNARGYAYLETGQYKNALDDFDKVLYGRRGTVENYVGRCLAYIGTGDGSRALSDCDRVLNKNSPQPEVLQIRALAYLKLKQYARAIADSDAALRLEPNNPRAIYARGIAKVKMGDVAAGNADIEQATMMSADIPAAMAKFGISP